MKPTDNVLKISYSTLPGLPIPWNTAELYEEAARLGFDGIKGDVTPTRDGRLIMCHDSFFSMTEVFGINGIFADVDDASGPDMNVFICHILPPCDWLAYM
jgi:glycerophosphoryl diester phosphodiesterase